MKSLNDWEIKMWANEWGKYFPEVEIKEVNIFYYDDAGQECSRRDYEEDRYNPSIRYDIISIYEDKAVIFGFLAHRHQLEGNMIDEIISYAYGKYYLQLNRIKYPKIFE